MVLDGGNAPAKEESPRQGQERGIAEAGGKRNRRGRRSGVDGIGLAPTPQREENHDGMLR